MTQRIPHADTEVRQAFQRLSLQTDVITTGTAGYLLVGAGIGVAPAWQTILATIDHGSIGGLGDDDHAIYHTDARGDARYYTEAELDAGQLDTLYFGEDEHLATSAGAADAGKPIVLDAAGHVDATMINDADVDHANLSNVTSDQHHAEIHTAVSHSDIASTGAAIDAAVTVSHAESHNAASHSDIASTGAAIDAAVAHSAHNLTTDIDHASITNTHNLTTDIDHASITNTHNLTTDIDHASITNTHNLTTDIDHASITGTHNLTTDINHNTLLNYEADRHIAHSVVTITAGSGLTGGGDITLTRTIDLDINKLDVAAIAVGDFIPFWDISGTPTNKKISLANFIIAVGASDEKVKVDVGATAGYLGAAAGDGVLRVNGALSYVDGGDYVTLGGSGAKAKAYLTSNQDIPDSTKTKVDLDTEDFDPGSDFASGAYTAPATGYYFVCGKLITHETLDGGKYLIVYIYVNGVQQTRQRVTNEGAGATFVAATISDIVYAESGQDIELYAKHNQGANRELAGYSMLCALTIHRLS